MFSVTAMDISQYESFDLSLLRAELGYEDPVVDNYSTHLVDSVARKMD
jgi:hypothetical protein